MKSEESSRSLEDSDNKRMDDKRTVQILSAKSKSVDLYNSQSGSSNASINERDISNVPKPMGDNLLMETFKGFISSPKDAILVFEACRLKLLSRVQRRLSESERFVFVRSGAVFVWDETESGIKRWTDGRHWSPSRINGLFLIYREVEPRKKISSNGSSEDKIEYVIKDDGLTKKAISITTLSGTKQHLVSYYSRDYLAKNSMNVPCKLPMFNDIIIPTEIYPEHILDDASVHSGIGNEGSVDNDEKVAYSLDQSERSSVNSRIAKGGHHHPDYDNYMYDRNRYYDDRYHYPPERGVPPGYYPGEYPSRRPFSYHHGGNDEFSKHPEGSHNLNRRPYEHDGSSRNSETDVHNDIPPSSASYYSAPVGSDMHYQRHDGCSDPYMRPKEYFYPSYGGPADYHRYPHGNRPFSNYRYPGSKRYNDRSEGALDSYEQYAPNSRAYGHPYGFDPTGRYRLEGMRSNHSGGSFHDNASSEFRKGGSEESSTGMHGSDNYKNNKRSNSNDNIDDGNVDDANN